MNRRRGMALGTQTHQREQQGNVRVNLTQEQRDNIPTLIPPTERSRLRNAITLALEESELQLDGSAYIEIVNRLQATAVNALDLIAMIQRTDIDCIINDLIINFIDQFRGRM